MAQNAALEEWLTTFVGASTSLKKLYYETKQLKSMHGSLGLDAALGTDLPSEEKRTKAEIDAVLAIFDAMTAFVDTSGRLTALEKISRTV